MAAVGPLADARSAIVTEVTNAGYAAVTDPRNARPLSVFVELPTITAVTHKVLDLTFTLRVLGAPQATKIRLTGSSPLSTHSSKSLSWPKWNNW